MRTKNIFTWLFTMICCLMTATSVCKAQTPQPKGEGTEANPYEISNADELFWFMEFVNQGGENANANAKLTANITVNTNVVTLDGSLNTTEEKEFREWAPIVDVTYSGIFDGQGFTISGLYFNNPDQSYVGLFGQSEGTIKNVGVIDSYIYGCSNLGGICGINKGSITNCYYTGSVCAPTNIKCRYIGGICGSNQSSISNCYYIGSIEGYQNKGGICGSNAGTITNCYYSSNAFSGNAIGSEIINTDNVGKTTEQFLSGEVAFLLSQDATGSIWGQDLSDNNSFPCIYINNNKRVYKGKCCGIQYYTNTKDENYTSHDYDNGFCKHCGDFKKPESNDGVYKISNAGELFWFANQVNSGKTTIKAVLTQNIIVNQNVLGKNNANVTDKGYYNTKNGIPAKTWTPIGSDKYSFEGTFDGQGFTISGLYFNNPNQKNVGLFGENTGTIKNVGVIDSYFFGNRNVGGICGYNYDDADISNCYNTGFVSGYDYLGGVCGYNYNEADISNCYNTGFVSGYDYLGGICGYNYDGTDISYCYNTGSVSGYDYVGGVCGYNKEAEISNCYNTGSVSGNNYVGGFCGYNEDAEISNCYNSGSVLVTDNNITGGLCAENNGTIDNSYYLAETADDKGARTIEQFNSGEVAYQLSEGKDGEIWGQYLSDKNSLPILYGPKINKNEDFTYDNNTSEPMYDSYTDTYYIANADQLFYFADIIKKGNYYAQTNAILIADIIVNQGVLNQDGTLNEDNKDNLRQWVPIGYDQDQNNSVPFQGIFDGQGYTISGLYLNNPNQFNVGLFGKNKGTIKNVGIVNSYFNAKDNVGGVCGHNYQGNITNCYNTATINGNDYVGGVCGFNEGDFTNCYNTGTINGNENVGGVCGECYYISNCFNSGFVNGNINVGGVCGTNGGDFSYCYNTGSVKGKENVGGVTGVNSGDFAYLYNCYNTGSVSGDNSIGGIAGLNEREADISNCYYNIDFCSLSAVGTTTQYSTTNNVENISTYKLCNLDFEGFVKGSVSSENDTITYNFPKLDNVGSGYVLKGSLKIVENSFPATIVEGSDLDLSEAQLTLIYDNGNNDAPVAITQEMISGFDNTKVGEQEITITYEGITTKFTIEVLSNQETDPTETNEITTQTPIKVWSFDRTIYINVETPGIEVRIVDLNSRLIKTERLESTNNTITLNREGVVIVVIEGVGYKVGLK